MRTGRVLAGLACLWLLVVTVPDRASAQEKPSRYDVSAGTLWLGDVAAPLLDMQVEIRVTGLVARTRVIQSFENPSDAWVEGVYVFPLPERAAVDHMRLRTGDREIEGLIAEKREARKRYERAKRRGNKAALVEQERPNVFTTSVANLEPRGRLRIELEYQQDLRWEQGGFSLRFPMVVGPRYIPAQQAEVLDAGRITSPVVPPGAEGNPVTLRVSLHAGMALRRIQSSSHTLRVERNDDGSYEIELADAVVPADRDFVLSWVPRSSRQPGAAVFSEELDGELYALVVVFPPSEDEDVPARRLPREAVFVVDTSGSMNGPSIAQARAALQLALARLQPDDRFNVIAFDSHAQRLFERSLPASSRRVEHARAWVAGLEAEGGTEMLSALQLALPTAREETAGVRQVVFITDGAVGNEAQLFRYIREHLGSSRLFTVGIGSAPNAWFMTKAADFGRGSFTFIGSPAEVGDKMGALFEKLERPLVRDIELDFADPRSEMWPRRVPDLYSGEPIAVAVRLSGVRTGLEIRGRTGERSWKTHVELGASLSGAGIHKLWARRKVASLMDELRTGVDSAEIRERVVALGLRHGLVTRYTSLVAVERIASNPTGMQPQSHQIPVNMPAGWSYLHVFGQLPQTATPAPALLLFGLALLTGAGALVWRRRPSP
jgi:Ca-activated chloride channel family protein